MFEEHQLQLAAASNASDLSSCNQTSRTTKGSGIEKEEDDLEGDGADAAGGEFEGQER